MFGGTIFRVIAALALVGLVVAGGVGIYNAGINEGLAQAALAAAQSGDETPVVVPPYGYGYGYGHWGWGGGFGFFGIIFAILGIFLIFGLLRAAFGWGRWGGPGGSGGSGGWQSRRERMEELHRELHRQTDAPGGSTP